MISLNDELSSCETVIGYTYEDPMVGATAQNTTLNAATVHDRQLHRFEENSRPAVYGNEVLRVPLCRRWLYTGLPQHENASACKSKRFGSDFRAFDEERKSHG